MKKFIISAKTLSISLLCAFVVLIPSLTSCQKEKSANVSDLLSTVPSSAGVVVGFNLNSLLEKAGCKVDGSSIIPGKELQQILDAQSEGNSSVKETIRLLLSGKSGIDPVGAVLFTDAYSTYVTAALADTDKFCAFVEQQTGTPFEDAGKDIKVSGNIAVSGAQMWMSVTSATTIDTKAIRNYASLQEAQSFSSQSVASDIAIMKHDVVGYGQIKNFTNSWLSVSDIATVNFLIGFLFDKASALSFNVDFLKGETKTKAMLLNDKDQPAKYLLPGDKINVDRIKSIGPSANAIFAIAITKDLVKKLNKLAEVFGGNMMQSLNDALSSLDGTAAWALSDIAEPTQNFKGVVTTDGNPPLSLLQLLSQFGGVRKEDKTVEMINGTLSGSLEIAKAADRLKGAAMGIIANLDSKSLEGEDIPIKTMSLTLNPESGTLSLNSWIETFEPDTNALLTFLKKAAE